ncbi:Ger(x)C family spore germination protein [Haloplasma contractile]|uniref:Spore germination protein YfkR n=1 Tax=Haloplasma contractile SSD-17B TaxID=1033810 RepID=F7PWJ4_9MOLU|nr:germination protein Ger(x)C [Haloplasma contractile]ERJ10968.1 Putative spore germination protein YfkR [Haloplasma contractile SSD-17B]
MYENETIKKVLIISIVSVALLLLTGCWGRRELNELAITTAIAVDKADYGYNISVQVAVPSEVAGDTTSSRVAATTYQAQGKTIFEAMRKITTEMPRKIYVAHLQTLIISEEVARERISQIVDIMFRHRELRTDFYILVTQDTKADRTLHILTALQNLPKPIQSLLNR